MLAVSSYIVTNMGLRMMIHDVEYNWNNPSTNQKDVAMIRVVCYTLYAHNLEVESSVLQAFHQSEMRLPTSIKR